MIIVRSEPKVRVEDPSVGKEGKKRKAFFFKKKAQKKEPTGFTVCQVSAQL